MPLPRYQQKIFVSLTAFGLVVSACSTPAEEGGYDVADRVIAAVGLEDDRVEVFDSGCERAITIDEYGFETETVTCPEDAAGNEAAPETGLELQEGDPINADQLLAFADPLPSFVLLPLAQAAPTTLQPELLSLELIAQELSAACGVDIAQWSDALSRAGGASQRLNDTIADADLGEYIASAPARALGRALFEQILFQPECRAPGARAIAADDPETAELLTLTASVSAAVAQTDRLLAGSVMTRLFHFFSALPSYRWLRNPLAPPGLIVLGSSQAGEAIEVADLARQTGFSVGNGFLPGSLAEVQQHWIEEVYRYATPEVVVWTMGPVDLIGTCISPGRAEQFVERRNNRQNLFASAGWFSRTDPISLALGPIPPVADANMGNTGKAGSVDQSGIDAQLPDYTNQFADPAFCQDRADVTIETILDIERRGARVIIAAMPVNPLAEDLVPGGAVIIAAAFETLRVQIDEQTGADVINFSTEFADERLWRDLTHLQKRGADLYTRRLAEELAVLGVGR